MNSRLTTELRILLSRDSAQRERVVDDCFAIDESIVASEGDWIVRRITLPASTTDRPVDLEHLDEVSTLALIAEQAVSVKLQDIGALEIPLEPLVADESGNAVSEAAESSQHATALWRRGRITEVYLSNPSATASAVVHVIMVGPTDGSAGPASPRSSATFTHTVVADAAAFTVTIPAPAMVDTNYAVLPSIVDVPGGGAVAAMHFPSAGRTTTTFGVVATGTLSAGTTIDFHLRRRTP